MQKILVGLFSIIALFGLLNLTQIQRQDKGFLMDEQVDQWLQWKQLHNRNQGVDYWEHIKFANFKENSAFIAEHNSKQSSYTLEQNQFMDLSFEEFSSMFGFSSTKQEQNNVTASLESSNNPSQIDWRYFGAVSPVKSQGQSQSSWAFAVTGTLETLYWGITEEITSFSEQQLIDCTDGGFKKAYEFAETHGVSSSGNYPYKGGSKNTCQNKNPQFVSKHHISVQPNSELALENALVANTVAATMRLSKSLQFYKSGVLDGSDCNNSQQSVALLVTGFNNTPQVKFYSLRNNWGTTWGEAGYIRVVKNGDGQGTCGIQTQAMYPTLQ